MQDAQEEQKPAIKGTIPAPEAKGEEKKVAETKRLRGLAKIDEAAAKKAALDTVPGEVKKIELGDEDGFLVYDIDVLGQDGKTTELKVDAGDGTILAQENEEYDGQGDEGVNGDDE
jgi:uncharacterized membrane protein YkoI